jgi:hypothetical protein
LRAPASGWSARLRHLLVRDPLDVPGAREDLRVVGTHLDQLAGQIVELLRGLLSGAAAASAPAAGVTGKLRAYSDRFSLKQV